MKGNLYIGGRGVAKGYYGDDERTKASFSPCVCEEIYDTGDIVYYRHDGEMIFCGRRDCR